MAMEIAEKTSSIDNFPGLASLVLKTRCALAVRRNAQGPRSQSQRSGAFWAVFVLADPASGVTAAECAVETPDGIEAFRSEAAGVLFTVSPPSPPPPQPVTKTTAAQSAIAILPARARAVDWVLFMFIS
jgi:hypothetical protein